MYKIKAKIGKPGYIRIAIQGLHPKMKNLAARADVAVILNNLTPNADGTFSVPPGSIDYFATRLTCRIIDDFMYNMSEKSIEAGMENPYGGVRFDTDVLEAVAEKPHYYNKPSTLGSSYWSNMVMEMNAGVGTIPAVVYSDDETVSSTTSETSW